jgi:hypothetical protein
MSKVIVSSESVLIVDEKGHLKRIRCPFIVLVIVSVGELDKDQEHKVQSVLSDPIGILVYTIKAKNYYYWNFLILD